MEIATVYHFNQLGSLFLRRDTDDTGGAVTAAGSGGIKTVTAELFESFSTTPTQIWNRYVLSSNPFRSSADSTMGWTLRSFDTEGRVQAVKFYRGSTKPTPATAESSAAGFTGKIQYDYTGDTTTVTDPAPATRTTVIDSLGRLVSVSDGGLSSASYVYDAVDNLKSVNQSGQVRQFFYTSLGRLRQATNPESGTTSYEYYPGGALKKRTDARTATVNYTVDGLNRVTKKTYTGGAYPLAEGTFCYDGKAYDAVSGNCVAASRSDYVRGALTAYGSRKTAPGNLLLPVGGGNPLQTTAVASTAVNAIDALGNPGSSTHQVAGFAAAQTVSYTYNVGGALTQLQYPSGKVVQYDVNGTNRTSAVRRGAGSTDYYATGVTYAATGAMAAATMGQKPTGPAAFTQSWSYNSRLQPRQMSAVNAASQSLLRLRLAYAPTYDGGFEETAATNNGNPRVEQVDYFAAPSTTKSITRTFDYDGANRIKKLDDGGNIQNLDYDAYGNVWQVGASTGIPELKQTGSSWYTATNQLTGVQFDAAGNQEALTVNGPSALQMRYDAEGRMVRVENTSGVGSVLAEYDYDANGKRVVRKANNAVIQYLYGLGGQLLSEYGGAVSGGGTKYLLADHLGSTRMVVDDAGGCVSRMDYAPFGAEITRNTAAWPCYVSAAEVSQKFTGKERDAETGLDYFGARYFSGAMGQLTSPDAPFADQFAADPQSWNLYAYVRNNPLKNIDPTGTACFDGRSAASCGNYILGGLKAVGNIPSDVINTPNRLTNALISPFTNFRFPDAIPATFTANNVDQQEGMAAAQIVMIVAPIAEAGAEPPGLSMRLEPPQKLRSELQKPARYPRQYLQGRVRARRRRSRDRSMKWAKLMDAALVARQRPEPKEETGWAIISLRLHSIRRVALRCINLSAAGSRVGRWPLKQELQKEPHALRTQMGPPPASSMNTNQILEDLDKHASEFNFPVLDNAYVEFAATRLTAFRGRQEWLICFEILGFSTREITFVDDLYAYGSCIDKSGYFSEEVLLESAKEQPLFDAETNECVADWSNWSVDVFGQKLSLSPTREDYAEAGITIDRSCGPGSLKEIELMRFLVHRLGEERLFMSERVLLSSFPRCSNLSKFLQTTQWHHPDVAGGDKPSENVSIRSLVIALAQRDPSLFMQGQPNTHWKHWAEAI